MMEQNNVDHGNDQEKLFTQEEVNAIIKKRLKREAGNADPDAEERSAALDEREAELNKRALKLDCVSYLFEQGYDADLIDVISADSLDDFKAKANKISGMITSKVNNAFVLPLANTDMINVDPAKESLKAAFAPDYKHTPADPGTPTTTK